MNSPSAIQSNQEKTFSYSYAPQNENPFLECSESFDDNGLQEYQRLTKTTFHSTHETKFKNLKTKSDDAALAGIVLGVGWLAGGPIGLGAGLLLLGACSYPVENIGVAEQSNDGAFQAEGEFEAEAESEVRHGTEAEAEAEAPSEMGPNAGADAGPALPSTLVGWWPLDGNLLDFSGRGNHLTFFGDEDGDLTNNFISDRTSSGQALGLDGVNDDAQTAAPVLLDFSDRWTIAFWLYLESDGLQTFFTVGNVEGEDTYRNFIEMLTNDGMRNLTGNYYGDEGALLQYSTLPDVLQLNTWQHVAITNAGGATLEDLRVYVNCVSQPLTLAGALTPQSDLPRSIRIGRQLDNDRYVNGAMDEFIIHNTAPDETTVSETFCR